MLDDSGQGTAHTFQVDLQGLVALLSHHLYSSPRIYIRELLQNAVDAVTARRERDPQAPTSIKIDADGRGLRIEDCGIGLTEADVHRFLATIGRSSKRDEVAGVEEARKEFLGQFGIGLLACFVVADEIRVVTKSAADPQAPPVEWKARSDGSYTVARLPEGGREGPGTTVEVRPRGDADQWFAPQLIAEVARDFGSLLPYDITLTADGVEVPVTDTPAVWRRSYSSSQARWLALKTYAERTLGFTPMDAIDLDLPVAGVRGIAYILPTATSPADHGRHRVYLKGMLLTDSAASLLPDWAFFARCVIETDTLRPTASREGLYEDETLSAIRDALGSRVRQWLTELAANQPERLGRFLSVHRLGVKALARHDEELFRIMLPWLPFETTDGVVSMVEFTHNHQIVHVTRTVEEFRQVAPIAAAQGLGVVNGGYTYDDELIGRLPSVLPHTIVAELATDIVLAHLDMVDPADERPLASFLATARARLDPLDCDVVLRAFHPVSLPALYLDSGDARRERARASAEAEADDLWSEILSTLRSSTPRAQLVLNQRNPLLRTIAALPHPELVGTAIESLYGQALLMTHRPLRANDTALLNRTFGDLLSWAAGYSPSQEERSQ